VNDVLLSLAPSDEAIAKASEIVIVDIVDWFDVKLANLFSSSPSVNSRKSSTFPLLGVKMITSVSESIFSSSNAVKRSKSTSSNDGVVERKDVAMSVLQNKNKNEIRNKEYSVLLAMKFESIAQVWKHLFLYLRLLSLFFASLPHLFYFLFSLLPFLSAHGEPARPVQ
jgi:hypothetical protein